MTASSQHITAAALAIACLLSPSCRASPNQETWTPLEGDFDSRSIFEQAFWREINQQRELENEMAERLTKRRGFLIKAATEYRLYNSKQDFASKPTSGYSKLVFLKPYKCPAVGEDVLLTGYKLKENRILVSAVDVYLESVNKKPVLRNASKNGKQSNNTMHRQ